MKKYELVFLNKGIEWTRDKDLKNAQEKINEMIKEGWELQQIVSPNDLGGAMVGVFYKEKE